MKTGFIGAGKMGEAIVAALLGSKTTSQQDILVYDISAERRKALKREYGVNVYSTPDHVVDAADTIVLGVKPQELATAVAPFAEEVTEKHLVLSIAAGKTLAVLDSLLPTARLVRVMPNLPALVGEGMSAFCLGPRTRAADRRVVTSLLESFGAVVELPEEQFDVVTALSGSGPAFYAHIMDAMASGAQSLGLTREQALKLAGQTMLGTAKLLLRDGSDPRDLIKAVASPKGTTAEGLAVLEPSDVASVLASTLSAAARRSAELSQD